MNEADALYETVRSRGWKFFKSELLDLAERARRDIEKEAEGGDLSSIKIAGGVRKGLGWVEMLVENIEQDASESSRG